MITIGELPSEFVDGLQPGIQMVTRQALSRRPATVARAKKNFASLVQTVVTKLGPEATAQIAQSFTAFITQIRKDLNQYTQTRPAIQTLITTLTKAFTTITAPSAVKVRSALTSLKEHYYARGRIQRKELKNHTALLLKAVRDELGEETMTELKTALTKAYDQAINDILRSFVDIVREFEGSDIVGSILIAIAGILFIYRLRQKAIARYGDLTVCPDCGEGLHMIHRNTPQKILASIFRLKIRRYQCKSCDFDGLRIRSSNSR